MQSCTLSGSVGSTYNFAGPLCRRIIRAFETGNLDVAQRAQALHARMVRCLKQFPMFSALKATMKLSGFDCGPNRLPLQPLTDSELAELKAELESIGFFRTTEREALESKLGSPPEFVGDLRAV